MASTDSVETRSSRPPRSRPAAGSSSSSSSGSVISARAIWTRLRSPSLRVPKVRSARCSAPTSREQLVGPVVVEVVVAPRASARPRRTTRRRRRRGPARRAGSARRARRWSAPIRGRSSKTSTVPSTSSRIPATPSVGWICAEATWSSVVLPAPLGPRTTQRSSSSTRPGDPVEQGGLSPPHGHVGELEDGGHGGNPSDAAGPRPGVTSRRVTPP